MRSLLVLLLLAVAGIAVYWTMSGDQAAAPPVPAQPIPAPPSAAPSTPPSSERSLLSAPTPPNVPDPATPAATPAATNPVADAADTNVLLHVHDVTTGAAIEVCRWRFRGPQPPLHGEGNGERLGLSLPPATRGELLLEADGHSPWQRAEFAVPAAGEAPLELFLFLTPTVLAAGITLLAHDAAMQPITNVRVDAFRITDDNRDLTWSLGNSLWARRASNPNGRFPLPPLPAGEYGLRLVAVDHDGRLLPYLPYSHTFTLTGDNGFVEDVTLEPGCLPVFELVDATNNPFDPSAFGSATLSLRFPGGPNLQRKWVVENGTIAATAIDVLPGVGPCWPAEPVSAGLYTFEVFVNSEPRVQTSVQLHAGERQILRIVVP